MIFPHTITIHRAVAGTDAYGDPTVDWSDSTSTTSAAWIQPRTSSEENDNRAAIMSGWMVFLPAETPVQAADRVVWEDRTYEVDGEPAILWNPSGPHHVEAPLKRITG